MTIVLGKTRTRAQRILRGAALLLLALCVALVVGYVIIMRMTAIRPPPPDPSAELPMEVHADRASVGPSWMSRKRGIWEVHLEGEPYAMGFAHGRLGARNVAELEDYMFGEIDRYVPSRISLFLIRLGVRLKFRHLPDHIPPDRQREIAGLSRALPDRHSGFLPMYHRQVFYHAVHEITQGLERSPLLGCTAFAASGAATSNGHVMIGRNFDFEGPPPFDGEKAVLFFKPKGKIPFASVAWVGMAGVVTGINVEGIYVSVNAARTDDPGQEGVPVELLTREILENAHSLDDAVALVRNAKVMVPDFYLVADGKTGESAVIERSPSRIEVRRSRDTTILTNHALTPAFASDVENDRLKRYLTSGARYNRLAELVHQKRGVLDPARTLEILRDKSFAGGSPLGLGNRNALDALIATHSVVVDATSLNLWVSMGPHCLGKYVGFNLRRELLGEGHESPADLPEDPLRNGEEHRNFEQAQAELAFARSLLAEKNPTRALESAERAKAIAELLPEPHRLIGDIVRHQDRERARKEYQRFLELHPPYLKDVEEVRGLLSSM